MEWRFSGIEVKKHYCLVGKKLSPNEWLIKSYTTTKDLADLIVFMVNSYIRSTDFRHMKHKHFGVINLECRYLRLTLPQSKGHSFSITTMPWAVKVCELICRRQEQEFGRSIRPEDNVFIPHSSTRGSAIEALASQFDIVLSLTNLKIINAGEPITLYSLGHSSIMFRLMFGLAVDTLILAKNVRTSLDIIDRFTLHHYKVR
jgi:hypothetical protein